MSKLKKLKVLDKKAENKYAFSDFLGKYYTEQVYISEVLVGKKWTSSDTVKYMNAKEKYVSIKELKGEDILNVFSQKLYTKAATTSKKTTSKSASSKSEALDVLEIDAVKIYFGYLRRSGYYYNYNNNDKSLVFSKKEINKLKTMNVYFYEEGGDIELTHVNFGILKEGENVYYPEAGTCKVLHIYEPNVSDKLCKLESLYDNKTYEIQGNGYDLYQVPYENRNIFSFLNIADNENLLKPFILGEGQTMNVCWQGVEGASQYCVALYRFYQSGNTKKVYHLKDFIVDRNTTYLSVTGLVSISKCIVTVSAENREGEMIAKSRGIGFDNGGLPKFWSERD